MSRRLMAAAAAAVLFAAAGPATAQGPAADPLPRVAGLGAALAPLPPETAARVGKPGVLAQTVLPAQTAAAIGVRSGDVILAIDGASVGQPAELVAAVARLKPGGTVRLRVWREGAERDLSGKVLERIKESYELGVTTYGAVPFGGGHLRDILVMPRGRPDAPVVFLLQGYTCASIDYANPETAHRKLISILLSRGIGVYRIEKPGVGDSRGTPMCPEIDFDTEMAGFQAGYEHLRRVHGVPLERTFLFGHSMGGIEAPVLAQMASSPRGVAVFGTVVRNWHDYHFDLFRTQGPLFGRSGAAESEAQSEAVRETLRRFYIDRIPLERLAAESPERERHLREVIGWTGGPTLLGRHETFWQDLAHTRLAAAWRDTKSRVLSLYGGADLVALNGEDQRFIEVIVNGYRPGTATFVELPGVDHGMQQVGSPAEIRERARTQAPEPAPAFAPEVATTLADWVDENLRLPPVG